VVEVRVEERALPAERISSVRGVQDFQVRL